MSRIFITIDAGKLRAMVSETPFQDKVEELIKLKYSRPDGIYLLNDDFENWEKYSINKDADYILYHTTSEKKVIEKIQSTFDESRILHGSHEQGGLHYSALDIIFDDNDNKLTRIIKKLFKLVTVQQAFMQMVKDINLAHIMCLNKKENEFIEEVIVKAKVQIAIIQEHLDDIIGALKNEEEKSNLQEEIKKLKNIDITEDKLNAATATEFKAIEKALRLNKI